MPNVRLTKTIRSQIKGALLDQAFGERYSALEKEFNNLAEDIYNHEYTKAVKTIMESLPRGFFVEDESFYVRFGVVTTILYMAAHKPFAYKHHRAAIQVYDAGHAFSVRHEELVNRKKDLDKLYKEAGAMIDALLNSVTTFNRLIEKWPEVEPIVSKLRLGAASNLPTVTVAAINERLGI